MVLRMCTYAYVHMSNEGHTGYVTYLCAHVRMKECVHLCVFVFVRVCTSAKAATDTHPPELVHGMD